ncbi:MAG: AraC family transcriptional regulator [Capsulimonadaceae bacterium]|nr:AraC family transcriptional regulator [Capsulimonadaceae bacterium]
MSYNTDVNVNEQVAKLLAQTLRCEFHYARVYNAAAPHFPTEWMAAAQPAFSLMIEGDVETRIRGEMNTTLHWGSGDVLCLLPSMQRVHRIISGGNVRYCVVCATFEVLDSGLDLMSFFDLPVLYSGVDNASLIGAFRDFTEATEIVDPFKKHIVQNALCAELLRHILTSIDLKPNAVQRLAGIGRLSEAVDYLITHYAEAPDVSMLARLSCLSPSRFHAVFKETLDCAPNELVRRIRLDKAVALLASSDLEVAEIGQAVGWNDPFHFSRIFKRFLGVSPSRYRQNIRTGIVVP